MDFFNKNFNYFNVENINLRLSNWEINSPSDFDFMRFFMTKWSLKWAFPMLESFFSKLKIIGFKFLNNTGKNRNKASGQCASQSIVERSEWVYAWCGDPPSWLENAGNFESLSGSIQYCALIGSEREKRKLKTRGAHTPEMSVYLWELKNSPFFHSFFQLKFFDQKSPF